MSSAKDFPHPFTKLASQYRDMRRKLPVQVSAIAAGEFKENFEWQGYRGDRGFQAWAYRKYSRKNIGRAILIKTGRLKRSIRPAATFDYARVVSNVPYAQAHNEGFKGVVSVPSHRRKSRKGKTYRVKAFRRRLNIPARPFMITTQPLLNEIEKHVFTQLETIFKNS